MTVNKTSQNPVMSISGLNNKMTAIGQCFHELNKSKPSGLVNVFTLVVVVLLLLLPLSWSMEGRRRRR